MTHPVHTLALCAQCLTDTPLGPMRLAATARGLAGAWFEDQRHHPGPLAAPDDAEHPWLRAATAALAAYWRGEWPDVDCGIGDGAHNGDGMRLPDAQDSREAVDASPNAVKLDLAGTAFQQAVWMALGCIPPGETLGYASLAAQLGRPGAARAIGAAVGRNPVSVLLPCHRVLGRDGRLTGYAGGLARKQALLAHEAYGAQAPKGATPSFALPALPLSDPQQRTNESQLAAAPATRQAVR